MDSERQSLVLGAQLLHLIAEANGGKEPRNIWQYRRVARRFGVRIRILPAGSPPVALLRQGERCGEQGVIFVRRTHNMEIFRLELLHELAEAACRWDGVPPWVCQITAHDAATAAGELLPMRHPRLDAFDGKTLSALPEKLTDAQRELLDIYRTQIDLWQSQVDLSDKQTDLFREMAERLLAQDDDGDD